MLNLTTQVIHTNVSSWPSLGRGWRLFLPGPSYGSPWGAAVGWGAGRSVVGAGREAAGAVAGRGAGCGWTGELGLGDTGPDSPGAGLEDTDKTNNKY